MLKRDHFIRTLTVALFFLVYVLPCLHFVAAQTSTETLSLKNASVERLDLSNPVELVNPLVGTDSRPELSNGNLYPAIGMPWGMNLWTPQTGKMGDGWIYSYNLNKINGFKQTHQPSPWMGDYGQFTIMPVTGSLKTNEEARASWFSHKTETVKPYYYSVYLADYNIGAEMAPTERAVQFRFDFPSSDSSFIVVDGFDKGSYLKIIPEKKEIIGYSTRYSRGPLPNFKNYFVIHFEKAFDVSTVSNGSEPFRPGVEVEAGHALAAVRFRTRAHEKVLVRVASSFISFEQAEITLTKEIGQDDFENTKEAGRRKWNDVLSKIKVEGGTDDQVKTFYTCFYRASLFPSRLYELNAQNKIVHYSPFDGKIYDGYIFGGTGFWDTFRALYPFLNLVNPSINRQMQEGLVNDYKESGWLPEWSSPGLANCMIGNNSASVVAEAYLKGLKGYDINTLYEALRHGADKEGPNAAVGRKGIDYYNRLGYVPYNVGINENAARTLEYAYDDYAIYQLARALKRPKQECDYYAKRAFNYRRLFDSSTGLMRGRNEDGTFQSPFNPFKWGDAFTEGNSWHYTWSVFHDIRGLIKLMGGNKSFINKLDSVFTMPPIFDDSYYGFVIHEIREMQIVNMGQYAHGNQPIQHMLYLYNYAGAPWKTQYWVRETMNRLYKPTPDGYCGDEDNGQTSAWYLFSAMGFYPVCPASDQYVLGAPLFKKVTINLENGKKIVMEAPANNRENRYVDKMYFNGQLYDKNWISHKALMRGATMSFKMRDKPCYTRGTSSSAYPYSFSDEIKNNASTLNSNF
jgi:predicted alpha-1,2-mannosidase